MMRSYVNRLARFSSPDPLAGSIASPQSFNRYAYTRNDPINFVDPLGLDPCENSTADWCTSVSATPGGTLGTLDPFGFSNGPGGPAPLWEEQGGGGGGFYDPLARFFPQTQPPPPLECRPEFIAQAKAAWQRAFLGTVNTEAGFWARGTWQNPTYVPTRNTNEWRKISFRPYPTDVAFFHTHPNSGSPVPSPPPAVDFGYRRPGDGAYVPVYTASNRGLYVSDPTAKDKYVKLREGLDWLKPCL